MFLRSVRLLTTFLIIGLLAFGCGDDKGYRGGEDLSQNELVQDANALNTLIVQRNALSAATTRDRQLMQSVIFDIRSAAITLQRFPKDSGALQLLINSLNNINETTYLQEDQFEINRFVRKVAGEIQKYASIQGRSVNDLFYPIYTYRFSQGLAPFGTYASDGQTGLWKTREALDDWFTYTYLSRMRSNSFYNSYLLSPTFDLSKIQNPHLRLRSSFSLRDNDTKIPMDTARIINQAYKVKVSTDFESGNPRFATWVEVPFYTRLSAMDFDMGQSNMIDLSEWEGQKIVIALEIDYNTRVYGRHDVGWTIKQFDLFGLGQLPAVQSREKVLFEQKFTSSGGLGQFVTANVKKSDNEWKLRGYTKDSAINHLNSTTFKDSEFDTWAFSPAIDLANGDAMKMEIDTSVVRKYPIFDNWKILISATYDGSDPSTFTDWEEIPFKREVPEEGQYSDFRWKVTYDLKKYDGKKVVVAFHSKADKGQTSSDVWDKIQQLQFKSSFWRIFGLKIVGLNGPLEYEPVELKFDSYEIPEPPSSSSEDE